MPDFTQPIEMSFVIETVGFIFVLIGVGIALVKMGKKSRNLES
jgi:predicted permease